MGVDKENMTFLTLGGDKQKPLMYHRNKYRTWWAVVWGQLVQFTTFSYFSALSTCNLQYSSACTHIVLLCFVSMWLYHYDDVTMGTMAAQITSLAIVYSTFYSGADQSKHQSSASMAFVWGIHRGRWIPRTNGQLRGKCFHSMTSSWLSLLLWFRQSLYLYHSRLFYYHQYQSVSPSFSDLRLQHIKIRSTHNKPKQYRTSPTSPTHHNYYPSPK